MVLGSPAPVKDPRAIDRGKRAGRTHALDAIDRRISSMIEEAPELTEAQLSRLSKILAGAVKAIQSPVLDENAVA